MKIAQEPVSLETPIGEEEDSHLGDFIEDQDAPAPADAASFMLLKEQLEEVLNKCGKTQVFNHEFKAFNSGKTEFDDHREYLFITEVDNEKRNLSFPNVLRG